MAYERTIWKNREVERPRTYEKIENPDGTITLLPSEGTIIEEGTPIIAENMNKIEQGIQDAHDELAAHTSYAIATGTNSYAVNIQGITALTEGMSIKVRFQNANTGACTLNVNNLGSKTIKKSNGNDLVNGNIKAGQICHLVYTGSVFQLLGEGGEYGTATANEVLSGYSIGTDNGLVNGTLALSGNALAADVLTGKSFYNTNAKSKLTGTMPNRGAPAQTLTTQGGQYNLPSGYYTGGYVKAQFANLVAGNIREGVNIGGVVGKLVIPIAYTAEWTQRTSSFGASNIYDVAYGNGMWVAVGSYGKLATSTDGTTWTQRTSSFGTSIIRGVAYGNGMWVAVGNYGKLATSTDGTTWTQRTSSFSASNNIRGVAYDNGMWVAVGDNGKLATSTDGTTWTQRTSSFGNDYMSNAAYGNGLWVAVGMSGKLATSTDGTTWTQRTSSFGNDYIYDVAYGNGLWVAVGLSGKLATSTDGTTWTQRTSSFGASNIRGVAYDNGMWVAVGDDGKLATSTNGTTWTQRTSSFGNDYIYDVSYGNGMWVAVGDNGKLATLS